MKFERILNNGRLWAVMYDGDRVNILEKTFSQWNDYEWLRAFFTKYVEDLSSFFHITDIDRAVYDTVDDAYDLECLILDLNPNANLDELFRPLENTRLSEVLLGRKRRKGNVAHMPLGSVCMPSDWIPVDTLLQVELLN